MINIYGTHMTIYLEREKIKSLVGHVGPVGKRGWLPTFMVHFGLVGMGVSLPPCCDPYLTYGTSTLIVYGTITSMI